MEKQIKITEESKKHIDYATELFLQSLISDYEYRNIINEIKDRLTPKENQSNESV